MRRVLLAGVVLVVVMVVAWPRDESPDVRVGPWHGKTSQGYPLSFVVSETDGDLHSRRVAHADSTCAASPRAVSWRWKSGWACQPQIADRRFAQRYAELTMWISWSGKFPAEDAALGTLGTVFPALIGEELEQLRSEKCSAAALSWTAHPGEGDDEERADTPADLKLRVSATAVSPACRSTTVIAHDAGRPHLHRARMSFSKLGNSARARSITSRAVRFWGACLAASAANSSLGVASSSTPYATAS